MNSPTAIRWRVSWAGCPNEILLIAAFLRVRLEMVPLFVEARLLQPFIEILSRLDRHLAAHLVMSPTAKFGTHDVVDAHRVGLEPDELLHSGNHILLHT